MSKFPTSETFKDNKTKVQLFLEMKSSYNFPNNIIIRKTKQAHIYNITRQKFIDFYLEGGKFILGYSDKYLTKIYKNLVNRVFLSSTPGIYTYRLIKFLQEQNLFETSYFSSFRTLKNLLNTLSERLKIKIFITNSQYIHEYLNSLNVPNTLHKNVIPIRQKNVFHLIEPFDEIFAPMNMEKLPPPESTILTLHRSSLRFETFPEKWKNFHYISIGMPRGYNILISKEKTISSWELDELACGEFLYFLLRLKFLITKRFQELKKITKTFLKQLEPSGMIEKASEYGIILNIQNMKQNISTELLKNGLIVRDHFIFFSFSHSVNDFTRLKKVLFKINDLP